jgi:hypothetical protein
MPSAGMSAIPMDISGLCGVGGMMAGTGSLSLESLANERRKIKSEQTTSKSLQANKNADQIPNFDYKNFTAKFHTTGSPGELL